VLLTTIKKMPDNVNNERAHHFDCDIIIVTAKQPEVNKFQNKYNSGVGSSLKVFHKIFLD